MGDKEKAVCNGTQAKLEPRTAKSAGQFLTHRATRTPDF